MTEDEPDIAAGEYVLGVMDADRRRRFEARLQTEPALRASVARWEVLLSGLEPGDEDASAAKLWPRLAEALHREPSAGLLRTIRQDEGDWTPIGPGLEKKHLYLDPLTGLESCLIRMQPGAEVEAHHHAAAEECLVLEGDLTIGDVRLQAGDYQIAEQGTDHPVLKSEGGGVIFVRGAVT